VCAEGTSNAETLEDIHYGNKTEMLAESSEQPEADADNQREQNLISDKFRKNKMDNYLSQKKVKSCIGKEM
jgi:hypothetical protein